MLSSGKIKSLAVGICAFAESGENVLWTALTLGGLEVVQGALEMC